MIRLGFQPSQRPPAQRRCSVLGFHGSAQCRRAGNGQVDPARVIQPRCPCLDLGTGERLLSTALPWSCGIAQVLGPAASPYLCHGASPQFGGWQATRSSQSLPLLTAAALPFTKTSQQDHIATISVHGQPLCIPHKCPSTWSAVQGQGDTCPP